MAQQSVPVPEPEGEPESLEVQHHQHTSLGDDRNPASKRKSNPVQEDMEPNKTGRGYLYGITYFKIDQSCLEKKNIICEKLSTEPNFPLMPEKFCACDLYKMHKEFMKLCDSCKSNITKHDDDVIHMQLK